MRAAFKGIELNANANDIERIRERFDQNRHIKTHLFSNGIIDLFRQTRFSRSPEEQKILHWTIKPCNTPSNNWFICEKYVHHDNHEDNMKENDYAIGGTDEGKVFIH